MEQVLRQEEKAVFSLRKIYEQYGYLPYKMSRFEEYELYVRNKDFLLSDRVITFADRDGRLLALKPDVTLSIIKNIPDAPGSVRKLYYNENVYRPGKSDQGFKEILQAGLECVGDLSDYEISEVVLLAVKSLAALEKNFVLDISHMGLITSVMSRSGLEGEQRALAHSFLRKKNSHEMKNLCRNMDPDCAQLLLAFTQLRGAPETVLPQILPLLSTDEEKNAVRQLEGICNLLAQLGFAECVQLDFSVGSDMKYYSGVVFKGYLEGLPAGILSGGSYDKLLRKMGKTSKAIGFAIYLDMLEWFRENNAPMAVDTVLLYDDTADAIRLMQCCEALRKDGSVLASKVLPCSCTWKRVMKFQNGEAKEIETDD